MLFLDRGQNRPLRDIRNENTLGAFLARWDIDGDGAVDRDEHLKFDRIAPRCDLDGNGRIDLRDATTR